MNDKERKDVSLKAGMWASTCLGLFTIDKALCRFLEDPEKAKEVVRAMIRVTDRVPKKRLEALAYTLNLLTRNSSTIAQNIESAFRQVHPELLEELHRHGWWNLDEKGGNRQGRT